MTSTSSCSIVVSNLVPGYCIVLVKTEWDSVTLEVDGETIGGIFYDERGGIDDSCYTIFLKVSFITKNIELHGKDFHFVFMNTAGLSDQGVESPHVLCIADFFL